MTIAVDLGHKATKQTKSNISNSTIIDEDCFAAYCYFWMNLFKSVQCVQESMMINKN